MKDEFMKKLGAMNIFYETIHVFIKSMFMTQVIL